MTDPVSAPSLSLLVLYGSYRRDRAGIRLADYLVAGLTGRGHAVEFIDVRAALLTGRRRMGVRGRSVARDGPPGPGRRRGHGGSLARLELGTIASPCTLPRPTVTHTPAATQAAGVIALAAALLTTGCQSAYYAAAESVGFPKREILVSRVESARDAQAEAREEITDALTEFRKVVDFEGGALEARYKSLAAQLQDGEDAADAVRKRIAAVEDVAGALFREWRGELAKYSSAELRGKSEQQLRQARARYDEMLGAMKRAGSRLEPALAPLRDQVLFLKHNLNAQAIAGLKGEVVRVDAEVARLVAELDAAIAEANRFIAELEPGGG